MGSEWAYNLLAPFTHPIGRGAARQGPERGLYDSGSLRLNHHTVSQICSPNPLSFIHFITEPGSAKIKKKKMIKVKDMLIKNSSVG